MILLFEGFDSGPSKNFLTSMQKDLLSHGLTDLNPEVLILM